MPVSQFLDHPHNMPVSSGQHEDERLQSDQHVMRHMSAFSEDFENQLGASSDVFRLESNE